MSDLNRETVEALNQIKAEVIEKIKKETFDAADAQNKAVKDIIARLDKLEADKATSQLSIGDIAKDKNLRDYLAGKPVMAAATGATGDAGGYLIPEYAAVEMVQHSAIGNPIRELAKSVTISGRDYAEVESGIAGAAWGDESANNARADSATPVLTENRARVFTEYAILPASEELVEDAAFNVESWLIEGASAAFSNLENVAFWSGNGTSCPKGIGSYELAAEDAWSVGKLGSVTAAGSALAADDLIQLQTSLDDPYQANAVWLMNKNTFRSTLKLKAGSSAANMFLLWQPQLVNGKLENLLMGSKVRQFSAMPDFGAGASCVAYGDIAAGYVVVDRIGTTVLRQLDPKSGKINFYVRRRVGGMVRNSAAIKLLSVAGA